MSLLGEKLGTLLYYKRNMVIYAWNYGKIEKESQSLLFLAASVLVSDRGMLKKIISKLPFALQKLLLKVSFMNNRHMAISELISGISFDQIILSDILPDFGTALCWEMLINGSRHAVQPTCNKYKDTIRRMMECCGSVLLNLKNKIELVPEPPMLVDLSGFPVNCVSLVHFLRFVTAYTRSPKYQHEKSDHANYTVILNCTIDDETVKTVLDLLHAMKKYKSNVKVEFSRIVINSVGQKQLYEVLDLLDDNMIKALDMKYNNIASNYIAGVALRVQHFNSLETLALGCKYERINPTVVSSLGHALHQCPCLKRLDMSTIILSNMMELLLVHISQGLEVLNVRECFLTSQDVRFLSTSVHASTLLELDLSLNNLGNCITELIPLLNVMANQLEILHMVDVSIGGLSQVRQLVSSFVLYKKLRFLDLMFMDYTPPAIMEEAVKLGSILSLEILSISHPVSFLYVPSDEELENLTIELPSEEEIDDNAEYNSIQNRFRDLFNGYRLRRANDITPCDVQFIWYGGVK